MTWFVTYCVFAVVILVWAARRLLRDGHRHEWGPWRVNLTSLSAPWNEPVTESRHCTSCPRYETRVRLT